MKGYLGKTRATVYLQMLRWHSKIVLPGNAYKRCGNILSNHGLTVDGAEKADDKRSDKLHMLVSIGIDGSRVVLRLHSS